MRFRPPTALAAVGALALLLPLSASGSPEADRPSPQRAYCRLVKDCMVEDKTGSCTEALSDPIAGIEHDQLYCGWVRGFARRGIYPGESMESRQMWQFMGAKYHVMYLVADTLPMSMPALDLLMRDIPLAAKLINSYQGTAYTADYPIPRDSLFFQGSNGKSLNGQARELWIRDDHRERVYWGQGRVQVLKWKLVGNVVIEFRCWPAPPGTVERTCYSIRFTMFPANSFINAIMNMGMFRSVAIGKIQKILGDILQASQSYASGKPPVAAVEYTAAEKAKLKEFERLYRATTAPISPSEPGPAIGGTSMDPGRRDDLRQRTRIPTESVATSSSR